MNFTNLIKLLILMLLFLGNLSADSYSALYKEGVELYKAQKYKEAAEKFETILEQGRSNGELLYNLGNCYFRMENTGKSILYYEKAKKYLGNDPDLVYNLDIANSLIQNPILNPPQLFFMEWWEYILSNTSLKFLGFGILFLTFIIISFSYLIIYFSNNQLSLLLRYFRTISAVILVVLFILTILKVQFIRTNTFAIIMDKKSPLKSEPFNESKDLIFIPEGTKVNIKRNAEQWIEIELPDGNKGWVKTDQLGVI